MRPGSRPRRWRAPRGGATWSPGCPGRARDPGGALCLLHHLDVVPADPSEWSVDPFGGEIHDGYLWGRGAIDMKSMGVMQLMSMLTLARERVRAGARRRLRGGGRRGGRRRHGRGLADQAPPRAGGLPRRDQRGRLRPVGDEAADDGLRPVRESPAVGQARGQGRARARLDAARRTRPSASCSPPSANWPPIRRPWPSRHWWPAPSGRWPPGRRPPAAGPSRRSSTPRPGRPCRPCPAGCPATSGRCSATSSP